MGCFHEATVEVALKCLFLLSTIPKHAVSKLNPGLKQGQTEFTMLLKIKI